MIELKNIKKSFGHLQVLKNVSLSVEDGSVVVILGPSGSGKTTLLRSINFLERADGGQLTIGDKTVDMHSARKRDVLDIRRRTAMVFQNYNLFANKTALQNVTEGLIVARKMPKAEANERAAKALFEVGLEGKEGARPSELSGGQQQRVAIARAIAGEPDMIFFDEPTSALDPELIGGVLDVIRKLAEQGRTMIIVTHEVHFARSVASRVMFMDGGLVLADEDSHDFFERQKLPRIQTFLNSIDRKEN